MQSAPPPFDFDTVLGFVKEQKGFDNYPAPLGPDLTNHHEDFHNPVFPGDQGHGNTKLYLERHKIDVPQAMIDADRQSFRDALRFYMNPMHVGMFMCNFYRGDFFSHPAYEEIGDQGMLRPTREDSWDPKPWYIDDKFTLDLNNPERKNRNRTYYTEREVALLGKIDKAVPELCTTVLAYQAGFLAYAMELKEHIARNSKGSLTVAEQERGLIAIENLRTNFETKNFSQDLLPAIALVYYKRDPVMKTQPVAADFEKGFAFAFRVGLFKSVAPAPDGGQREITCPARVAITATSTRDIKQEVCAREAGGFPPGRMLHSIYKEVHKQRMPFGELRKIARSVSSLLSKCGLG